MATAKVLQKPEILKVEGSTIRVAHPDISGYPNTQAAAQISAGGTTLSVLDNNGFADDDWFIIGDIGDNQTEECDVNGAVTRGQTLTITNTLKFDHEFSAPVAHIQERGIKIYGASSDGGSGTLIASIDALTASGTQLADAVNIQWNRPYTEYTLQSTDTAYDYYYAVFTDGSTDSSASNYIPAAGWPENKVINVADLSLKETDTKFDNKHVSIPLVIEWANEAQRQVSQFKYQNPRNGVLQHVNWDFEIVQDASLTVSTNEIEYSLSSLIYTPKYTDSDAAIIAVQIGSEKPLEKITIQEFDEEMRNKPNTDVATAANAGDTTLTVDSNVEFADSGTLFVGGDEVTYTGKSGTTQFTGIPSAGTGSITQTHALDTAVWQNVSPDLPDKYVIWNGKILFNRPIKSDYDSYPLKVRMFKKLDQITEITATFDVPFLNALRSYIAHKIERRKGNEDKAVLYQKEFNEQVLNNALANNVPTLDVNKYYKFTDGGFYQPYKPWSRC